MPSDSDFKYSDECNQFQSLKSFFTKNNTILFEIKSVGSFIDKINEIQKGHEQLFYRGCGPLDNLLVPSIFRKNNKMLSREHKLNQECKRSCPEAFANSRKAVDDILTIQHYGEQSRFLDVTESPLASLAFAVGVGNMTDPESKHDDKISYIAVFDPKDENIKEKYSKTISIISSISRLENKFAYGHLQAEFKDEGFVNVPIEDGVSFAHIMNSSFIFRNSKDNARITNQMGAFIAVSMCVLCKSDKFDIGEFCNKVFDNINKEDFGLSQLHNKDNAHYDPTYRNLTGWDFLFKKVTPYDRGLDKKFYENPFNIERLIYKDKNNKKFVFIIKPGTKEKLRNELKVLGYKKSFLYPEPEHILKQVIEEYTDR